MPEILQVYKDKKKIVKWQNTLCKECPRLECDTKFYGTESLCYLKQGVLSVKNGKIPFGK